ncbi:MAG: hypothetical protein K6E13_08430 [Lachnospiraceae bacterium]|nr:hypothetical protein [Lachnospiraceae bacterium]
MTNININSPLNATGTSGATGSVAKAPSSQTGSQAVDPKITEKTLTEEYGPVVSTSTDGDTVRVKNEGAAIEEVHETKEASEVSSEEYEMQDFELPEPKETKSIETSKQDSAVKEAIEDAKAASEKRKALISENTSSSNITSFAGISDSRLRQMYLEGVISQNDYNRELESRETKSEASAEESQALNETMATSISVGNQADRSAKVISVIEGGQASETISINARLDAMRAIENISI